MSAPDLEVTNDQAAQRYEARLGEEVAFAEYRPVGDALMFTHTEVPEDLEGQGVGSALVRGALDDARARGLRVIPMCPFVAAFIQRHPDYADLVHPEQRGVFGL